MVRAVRRLFATTFIILSGCGSSEATPTQPPVDAGPPGCAPGQRETEEDGCQPAGVPPDSCAQGFTPDGEQGCIPILPATPCPAGQMAIPGETECRDVAPCGTGKWGDIPVAGTTQYVDAAYAGSDSDGTEQRPWTTITGAVQAAEPGAIVAVAEGSYAESVLVQSKPVRLWGRCPSLVEIVTPGGSMGGVDVRNGGSNTEVHTLAVTGATNGVSGSGAADILIDRVWLHDLARAGILLQPELGPVSMTVNDSLIEKMGEVGIYADEAALTIARSVIRDTVGSVQYQGRGLHLQTHADRPPGLATITACLIERNREMGIYVAGSHATIEGTVVRDTFPNSLQHAGRGLDVIDIDTTGQRSEVTVSGSVFERNQEMQIAAEGSNLVVESTTIRQAGPLASDGSMGRGIAIQDGSSRATLTLRESLVAGCLDGCVVAVGSDVTLESAVLRDVAGRLSDQTFGRGLSVQQGDTGADRGTLTMRWSVIEGARDFGIVVLGSDATVEASAVRNTLGSAADGTLGDGVAVVQVFDLSTATLTGSLIEHNARVGVSNFGSTVTLANSQLECNPIHLNIEECVDSCMGFVNSGGVTCGCDGATVDCAALSTGLSPPTALP